MSSIVPNFEYDVFISYRHKDNKGERWVTEFVNALKAELESTFKEDITIYFDANPHDGLLETHNVDKSLEEKLRCLIFIPIISQTYCDTKSFAWQNEFCAFNKLAKNDQFGRDIKLLNRNVASRILPIKIHDLDAEDKKLLEQELGGPLRGIEFIYKETGVNRPLKITDNKNDNQNKIDYRNQVNKVANAIKEILLALKSPVDQSIRDTNDPANTPSKNQSVTKSKRSLFIAISLLSLLCILLFLFYPKLSSFRKEDEGLAKTIAVLPFKNLSSSKDEYLSEGLTDQLITNLAHMEGFKVASATSVANYKNSTLSFKEIAQELAVNYILEGSLQKEDTKLRISARLIRTDENFQEWNETYNRTFDDILSIQEEISQKVANTLGQLLDFSNVKEDKPLNAEAYDHYLKGEFLWRRADNKNIRQAIGEFKKAIQLDSGFAAAYSKIGFGYLLLTAPWGDTNSKTVADSARIYTDIALRLSPTSFDALNTKASIKWWFEKDFKAAEQIFEFALENRDTTYRSSVLKSNYGFFLFTQGRASEALPLCLESYKLDPTYIANIFFLGDVYFMLKDYEKAEFYYREGLVLFPNQTEFIQRLAWLYITTGQVNKAKLILEENSSMFTSRDPRPWVLLAITVSKLGDQHKSKTIIHEIYKASDKGIIVFDMNFHLARYYGATNQKNKMYECLENSLMENDNDLLWLKVDPLFQDWRDEPLFKDILIRAGFK